jgi:hypothetical protein
MALLVIAVVKLVHKKTRQIYIDGHFFIKIIVISKAILLTDPIFTHTIQISKLTFIYLTLLGHNSSPTTKCWGTEHFVK